MKILITGTSSGFGKFLLDHYSTYCEVVSINRPEFDLKTSEFLDRIDDSVDYDIVIINAATRSTREDGDWSTVFDVNFTHQVQLVEKLKDRIKSKLIFMSSRSSSIQNLKIRPLDRFEYDTLAYKASKAALNVAMLHYSKKLSIPVVSITPGHISDLIQHPNSVVPKKVTHPTIELIDSISLKDTGKLFNYDGSERPL